MAMRGFWIGLRIGWRIAGVLIVLIAGCGHPPAHRPSVGPSSTPPRTSTVDPANIKRVVRDLPPNYEVTSDIPAGVSPRLIWGLDPNATSRPASCAALADPGRGHEQTAQGLSASGSGGIINVIVVALPDIGLDRGLVDGCAEWSMTANHTTAHVRLADPPHIDGADTVGMAVDITSTVESGTEIDSRAYTFIAYLRGYYAFTALTTDPGSALPALPPQFAADLLVKTVSTLRG